VICNQQQSAACCRVLAKGVRHWLLPHWNSLLVTLWQMLKCLWQLCGKVMCTNAFIRSMQASVSYILLVGGHVTFSKTLSSIKCADCMCTAILWYINFIINVCWMYCNFGYLYIHCVVANVLLIMLPCMWLDLHVVVYFVLEKCFVTVKEKALGSHVSQEPGCSDIGFSWFSTVSSGNFQVNFFDPCQQC
jgi:hypothetical protein